MKIKYTLFVILPLLLCASCLHSRSASSGVTVKTEIKVFHGSVVLRISGETTENLYLDNTLGKRQEDTNSRGNPAISERTKTKEETKYLSTNEEYTFWVLPSELVTLSAASLDGNDAEIIVRRYGTEKRYTISGTNKLGIYLNFSNK